MGLDLQSGRPWWLLDNPPLPALPDLERDERADVVVVGAGLTGALAAAALVEAGIDVVVLDRRQLACGSTGASTALISYEPDCSMAQIAARRGWEVARASYHAARDANRHLADLIQRLGIACSFEATSSVHLARTPRQAAQLREEHRLRNDAGLSCEYLPGRDLRRRFGLAGSAALFIAEAAQLDPVRLTAGLVNYVTAAGSRCYRAHVARIESTPGGYAAVTRNGSRVTARRVACATGYETQLDLRQDDVELVSTYVIASREAPELPAWLRRTILWDMDRPYHYARCAGGRIMVGGADEPFVDEAARDALMPAKTEVLRRYLSEILPGLHVEVASVWCGTFARTADSLPYIGEREDRPGAFFLLGYGGNGITFGMLGGLYLRDVVTGRNPDGLSMYSFERRVRRGSPARFLRETP